MSIEVIVKRAGVEPPPLADAQMRYLVASNGLFLERKTGIFTTSCRVESCPAGLEPHGEACALHCERIPALLTRAMLGFFRYAFDFHGGEAGLILLYDPRARRFAWQCPEQTVEMFETWSGRWYPSSRLSYVAPVHLPPGFVVLGDAHSHADLSSLTSHTDLEDERHKDGLHIIVGRLDRDPVDLSIEFAMDRRRFEISPGDILAEPDLRALQEAPRSWKKKIRVRRVPYGRTGAYR